MYVGCVRSPHLPHLSGVMWEPDRRPPCQAMLAAGIPFWEPPQSRAAGLTLTLTLTLTQTWTLTVSETRAQT